MSSTAPKGRRWLVPEVIQTSAMDCGPAVLACLLRGFGIPADYARLREACQTEVDGTSIDVLERIACQVGLHAEQVMLPADHLLLPESEAMPAIVVTVLPSGLTHFVLLWARHGPLVQVMDPGQGRRWLTHAAFLAELYRHSHRLPASVWHGWASSEGFITPLKRRMRGLGLVARDISRLVQQAVQASDWQSLGRLDAATRLVMSLIKQGGIRAGREAGSLLVNLVETENSDPAKPLIPEEYWSVWPAPPQSVTPGDAPGETEIFIRGPVLVRVPGPRKEEPAEPLPPLPPELADALHQTPSAWGQLSRLLGRPSLLATLLGGVSLVILACGILVEGLVLRGALDLGRVFPLQVQRLGALAFFLALILLLLAVERHFLGWLLQLGRRLETGLRLEFLRKLPRMPERYFHSRPVSDLAERSHLAHTLRNLPRLFGQFLLAAAMLLATTGAIAWLYPGLAWIVLAGAGGALVVPVLGNAVLSALDLRVRTHTGALTRFYLDALLGLSAICAHGAERTILREYESLQTEWYSAGLRLLKASLCIEAIQMSAGIAVACVLLWSQTGPAEQSARALLLGFWVLQLPLLGQELALQARQYPLQRNTTLRLLEPLGTPEVADLAASQADLSDTTSGEGRGASIQFTNVSVVAGGHLILQGIDATIPAGSHVGIVGLSGSGKSSLVGLLLGWHRPAEGVVCVDEKPLDEGKLQQLREQTAWVDPGIHLWNRSLLENLLYGCSAPAQVDLGRVLSVAELLEVLQRLPEGLQTSLGDGGGLVSGGESQRIRLGRGLARAEARLVILDEPFRGLDRAQRHTLLERVRTAWSGATLLCITHDVAETLAFDRVLVLEAGRLVEDGRPADLCHQDGSRYRALLDAETRVHEDLWRHSAWRRLRIVNGQIVPDEGDGLA